MGTETPANSGKYNTSRIQYSCAADSPIPCASDDGSKTTALGVIFSFGEDNGKDVFVLSYYGVYRIVGPSRCGYACPGEAVRKRGPMGSKGRRSSSPSGVVAFWVVLGLLLGFWL